MNSKSPTATTTSTEGKRFAPTKVKPGGLNNQSVKPGQQGSKNITVDQTSASPAATRSK